MDPFKRDALKHIENEYSVNMQFRHIASTYKRHAAKIYPSKIKLVMFSFSPECEILTKF